MDYSKLLGKVVEMFGTREKFAKHMGWSVTKASYLLSGTRQMCQKDILSVANVLGISINEIGTYFFTKKLDKCEE